MININQNDARILYLSSNDLRELNSFEPEIRHFTYRHNGALRYTLRVCRGEASGRVANWVVGAQSIRLGPILAVNLGLPLTTSPIFRLIRLTNNEPGYAALLSQLDARDDGDESPIPDSLLKGIDLSSTPRISAEDLNGGKKRGDRSWGEVPASLMRLLDEQQKLVATYAQMSAGPEMDHLVKKMALINAILDDVFSRAHSRDFNRVRSQKATAKPSAPIVQPKVTIFGVHEHL